MPQPTAGVEHSRLVWAVRVIPIAIVLIRSSRPQGSGRPSARSNFGWGYTAMDLRTQRSLRRLARRPQSLWSNLRRQVNSARRCRERRSLVVSTCAGSAARDRLRVGRHPWCRAAGLADPPAPSLATFVHRLTCVHRVVGRLPSAGGRPVTRSVGVGKRSRGFAGQGGPAAPQSIRPRGRAGQVLPTPYLPASRAAGRRRRSLRWRQGQNTSTVGLTDGRSWQRPPAT